MPEALELPSPVMGRAARFHDDDGWRLPSQERTQLGARQTVTSGNVAGMIRDSNFENGLCEIDSDSRILHCGFLLLFGFGQLNHNDSVTSSHQEESISSLQTDERRAAVIAKRYMSLAPLAAERQSRWCAKQSLALLAG